MSIELNPPELGFRRPFTREVVQTLHIKNSNHDPVAFKVKTTAPKQYCVRPNSGRIESGKEVEVQVLLQAMKEDLPPNAKCRDKFLVQSVPITADKEATSVQQIWSHIEKNEKSLIQEKKIRVLFLQADEQAGGNKQDASFDSSPPPYTAPTSSQTPSMSSPTPGSVSKVETTDATVVPSDNDDLQSQLVEARAKITRLEAELKDQGVRLRKTAGVASDSKERITSGAAGMGMSTQAPEGIPVQICAALCLGAFLIAWFFF